MCFLSNIDMGSFAVLMWFCEPIYFHILISEPYNNVGIVNWMPLIYVSVQFGDSPEQFLMENRIFSRFAVQNVVLWYCTSSILIICFLNHIIITEL